MTAALAKAIRELVAEDLATPQAIGLVADDRREFARRQVFAHLDDLTSGTNGEWLSGESSGDEQLIAQTVLDALFGMGKMQVLIDNPEIENIDINGCDRVWVTFADGSKRLMPPIADSDRELVDLIRSAASRFGLSERRFDLARPELDLRLPDGSRLSALMAVTERPAVSIRRHRFSDLSLSELIGLGTHRRGPGLISTGRRQSSEEHRGIGSDELGKDDSAPGPCRRDFAPRAHRHHRAGLRARSRYGPREASGPGCTRGSSGQCRGCRFDIRSRPGAARPSDERRSGRRRRGTRATRSYPCSTP